MAGLSVTMSSSGAIVTRWPIASSLRVVLGASVSGLVTRMCIALALQDLPAAAAQDIVGDGDAKISCGAGGTCFRADDLQATVG